MGIFGKMDWFSSPDTKEEDRKMDELAESAKKILEDESAVKAREITDLQEGQERFIEEARDTAGEGGYEEIKDLSRKLSSLLEEGAEHEKAVKALMGDYGWSDIMAKEMLSIVCKSIIKLGKKEFEPPDEEALHKNSPDAPSRDARLLIHSIIENDYGMVIAKEVDPLVDQIVGNGVKKN